jgi:hypothetical protein
MLVNWFPWHLYTKVSTLGRNGRGQKRVEKLMTMTAVNACLTSSWCLVQWYNKVDCGAKLNDTRSFLFKQ